MRKLLFLLALNPLSGACTLCCGPVNSLKLVGPLQVFANNSAYLAGDAVCTQNNGLCVGAPTGDDCPECLKNVTINPVLLGLNANDTTLINAINYLQLQITGGNASNATQFTFFVNWLLANNKTNAGNYSLLLDVIALDKLHPDNLSWNNAILARNATDNAGFASNSTAIANRVDNKTASFFSINVTVNNALAAVNETFSNGTYACAGCRGGTGFNFTEMINGTNTANWFGSATGNTNFNLVKNDTKDVFVNLYSNGVRLWACGVDGTVREKATNSEGGDLTCYGYNNAGAAAIQMFIFNRSSGAFILFDLLTGVNATFSGNVTMAQNLSVTNGVLITNRGMGVGNNTVMGLVRGDINVSTLHVSVTRTKSPEVVITGQYANGSYQPSLKCVTTEEGAWMGISYGLKPTSWTEKVAQALGFAVPNQVEAHYTLNDARCVSKIAAYETEITAAKEAVADEDCKALGLEWSKVLQTCVEKAK